MQRYFVPSLHELLSAANAPHYIFNKSYEEVKSEPILVLHTSGSTGIFIDTKTFKHKMDDLTSGFRHTQTIDIHK